MASPYACHNRKPYAETIRMQDGWGAESGPSRHPVMREVPFVMAKDCNFTHTDLGKEDQRCNGCKWRAHG